MASRRATWTNGKKTLTGSYEYFWHSDSFVIRLDSTDRITGRKRVVHVYGDDLPEWGNWKLVREVRCT